MPPSRAIAGVAIGLVLAVAVVAANRLGEQRLARDLSAPTIASSGFAPELSGVDLHAASIRPGDPLSYTLRFSSRGTRSAETDLTVFVHLEPEGAGCEAIAAQADHEPRLSTRTWLPGRSIADGPRLVTVPADLRAGPYRLHVGLFDRRGDGRRWLEDRSARVELDPSAPSADAWRPSALAEPELAQRRARAREPLPASRRIELRDASFDWSATDGWRLTDRRTGYAWGSDPEARSVATALIDRGASTDEVAIPRFESVATAGAGLLASARVQLGPGLPAARIAVLAEPTADGAGVRLAWHASDDGGRIAALRLVDRGLQATDANGGQLALPRYLGQVLRADRGLPHERWYRSNDLTMAMCGVVASGSALLVSWSGLDTVVGTHLEVRDHAAIAGRRLWSVSLDVARDSAGIELRPVGAGAYVEIARAYRAVAAAHGLRTTWADKKRAEPRLELLEGAPVFRFPCLIRAAPGTRYNPGEREVVENAYRFEEIARWAAHWKQDLGLERAHVVVSGWGREGYDRGHPDVMPPSELCGGGAALAACARDVAALGYVLTLHENLHDAYADAPSYTPAILRRGADGEPRRGGEWAGGQSWRVCPTEQIELARRNFARVRSELAPGGCFLDTTLTPPLEACHARAHPLDRYGDQRARSELFDLARATFGVLGLEGGAEWAVPSAAWFEGLLTHKTARRPGWLVVPLFPIVYGDCVALVPIQADKLDVADARKVLDLALYGAMPSFQLGPHLDFLEPPRTAPLRVELRGVRADAEGGVTLALRWHVDGVVPGDCDLFVHLVRVESGAAEGIKYQADHTPERPTSTWKAGEHVDTSAPRIELARDSEGPWEVQIGLHRGGVRYGLEGVSGTDRRTTVAILRRDAGRIRAEPAPPHEARSTCFARADGGWAAGMHATDRLVKNVTELLGPLHRRVVGRDLTAHRFLTSDGSVERSEFGDVVVTVNYGPQEFVEGWVRLPAYGVRIESPTFVAFHATAFGGVDYPGGALFTLTSTDGRPLPESRRIRVFHGFGEGRIALGGEVVEVPRERVWERSGSSR